MSNCKLSPGRVATLLCALAAFLALTSSIAPAQETASRVQVFIGYSWLDPGGRVATPPATPGADLTFAPAHRIPSITQGFGSEVTYNFNKWIGVTGNFGGHFSDPANVGTVLFGPTLSFRSEHFTPFVHTLVGIARISPKDLDSNTGFGAAVGGGLDMFLNNKVAIRVIEADWLRQEHSASKVGGGGSFDGARVQGGLVFGLGSLKPPVPPASSCTVQPTAVMAGEPVTANVTTQNFNPKHTLTYSWKSTGGTVTPKETAATIDTTGLAPGSYTVTATVTDPRAHRDYNTTSCNAGFTINEPPKRPPTLSCTANPTTVRAGEPATISCQGNSPDNRPLTYTCNPSAGRITGTGPAFTLDTAGASAGPITVNCTVTDDRGLSATSNPTVNVEVPPPPPEASKIGEIVFPNKQKPGRVDNTAKAILDDVALRLQRESDAKAVIVGYFEPTEKGGVKLAQQRAVNTKAYLTTEKGIDPTRIELRTGTAGGNRAEIYLVPPGATFNVSGTEVFDESAVKPATERRPARKPAARKPAPPA
ncbi:MAG: outer membrane beta-barrel protein [Terriglobales bacterium]